MNGSDASTGFLHKIVGMAGSVASSIRTKIVLPYAVLALATALVGTFVVTQLVAGSLEERFINQLVDAGRVTSDSVIRREREHLEALRATAFTQGVDVAVASGDMHTLKDLLVPLAVNHRIDSVEVTDRLGKELLGFRHDKGSTDVQDYTLTTDTDLSTWPIVTKILAGQVDQLGDKFVMLVKEPSGYYLFYTGGPIRYEDKVVGALLVGTYLDEFLTEIKQETLADVTFYDNQGQVLATTFRGGGEQVKDILQVNPAFCQSIIARPDETLRRSLTLYERPYEMAFGPLRIREGLLGVFSVALPSNFIVQKAATSRLQFGVIFTLAMMLVFVIGYIISRRIIAPIIRLVQTSRAIAAGDLSQQTGIRRGDEIGILASSFDQMTQSLRERTQELEEEASKMRAILESIADGVIVEDKSGQIIMMNPAAGRILGDMSEGFPDQPIRELPVLYAKGEPSAADSSEDRRFEAGGKVVSAGESPVVTKDGDELGKVMVFRDITREVAERNRRVKVETLAAIGDMTGIMAHRMNNILGAARANLLNISRKRARGELGPEFVEESLREVMGSIDKALEMLKTLSRPFRSDEELEEVDVNSCLSSALKRLTIPEGIQAIEDYTDGLPAVVATREYLTEVFGNLITNALEAMGDTGRLDLHSQLANNWIEVSVTDTGPGIPEELREKIFELGSSFKKTGEGLGFGLWWSRTFLERLGGSLHVESQVGVGSKFAVRLPAGAKRESE